MIRRATEHVRRGGFGSVDFAPDDASHDLLRPLPAEQSDVYLSGAWFLGHYVITPPADATTARIDATMRRVSYGSNGRSRAIHNAAGSLDNARRTTYQPQGLQRG